MPRGSRRRGFGWLAAAALAVAVVASAVPARAGEIVAVYAAYWAGIPAAEIRLRLRDGEAAYHSEIKINTKGLPHLFTHFRSTASAEGRLSAGRPAEPRRYDAIYDLRERRDRRVSMRFIPRGGTVIAERGPDDTSSKPPLAETFRSNTVDPVTAYERIRGALRAPPHTPDAQFVIPVYDGARRFDIVGRILPKAEAREGARRLELTLRPIAGFKGETSEDGDPDSAPRKVDLLVSDDARAIPLLITVPIFFMPLVVLLERVCPTAQTCPG